MNKTGLGTLIVVVIAAVYAAVIPFDALELRMDGLERFGAIIGTLVIVSAVLERGLDVILTVIDGGKADAARAKVVAEQEKIKAAGANADATALNVARAERVAQREKARTIASVLGLVFGTIISIAGLRTLHTLVTVTDPSQAVFLNSVDIVLTGALLAGGSDGLHKLVEVYRHQMDKGAGNP